MDENTSDGRLHSYSARRQRNTELCRIRGHFTQLTWLLIPQKYLMMACAAHSSQPRHGETNLA